MPIQTASRPRSRFRIAAWTLGALVVLVCLMEITLRLLFGLGNPIVVAPDAACSYIEAPNQHTYRFFHEATTNHYGMRSAAFAPLPAPGTLRIMFVGDSITYGTSRVGQHDLFTQILLRELPSIVHRPVEVLNASASGWAVDNEISYVRSRGIFHSGLVLLVLNSGDVSQPRAILTSTSQDSTTQHPVTAIGEIWERYLKPKLLHMAARKDAGDQSNVDAQADIRANLGELDQFQSLVAAQHARFAIIYVPFRSEIPHPADQAQRILHTWTADHHVPLFDMTDTEATEPTADITLDGGHFNVRGNHLVAEGVEKQWDGLLGTSW